MGDKIKVSIGAEIKDGSLQASVKEQEAKLEPIKVQISSKGVETKTYKEFGKDFDTITTKVKKADSELEKIKKTTIDYGAAIKRNEANQNSFITSTENFQTKLNNLNTTGGLTKKQFVDFDSQLKSIKTEFAKTGDIDKFNKQMITLKNKVSEASTQTKSLGQSVLDIVKKFTQWYLIAGAVTGVINALKSIVTTTIELDKAFTSIQMVTGYSDNQIKELRKSYIGLAKEMGVTVDTVTKGADEWLRTGLNVEETNEALRASIVLSAVAQMDSATATQYLVAAMNGFNLEASQLMDVVDKLSAIDVVAATSSEELAEAMSVSAKSAQLAGIDLDKYLGMIGAVSETTRQSASTIGNSFKTIFSRLQAVKIGSLFDEEGESISDVDRLLKGYGIDLMNITNNLEDMGALLDHLGTNWDNYTTAQQSEIATTVAGVRQREKFLVLMEEYDRALELEQTALESNGSAMDKYEIYQESLEANINRLKDAWVDFVNNLNATGFIDFLLDAATGIMDLITSISKWIDSLGKFGDVLRILIPVVIGATAAIIAFKAIITGGLSLAKTTAVLVGVGVAVGSLVVGINSLTGEIEANTDAKSEDEKQTNENTKANDKYAESLANLKQQLTGQKSAMDSLLTSIKEESEELKRQEDLQQKLLSVEKAREELAKAKNKRVRIFRAGVGFVYESDASEVQTAQESLNEALNDLSEYKYELALQRAEDFVDELDDLLKNGDIINGWEALFDKYADLMETEFSSYLTEAQEFVNKFNLILGKTDDSKKIRVDPDIYGGYEILDVPASHDISPSESVESEGRATGTLSQPQTSLDVVGEKGPELRIVNKGDGIIPSDITKNLVSLGSKPAEFIQRVSNSNGASISVGTVVINEPNNFDGFVRQFCSELNIPQPANLN